jgi:hypothetical protein
MTEDEAGGIGHVIDVSYYSNVLLDTEADGQSLLALTDLVQDWPLKADRFGAHALLVSWSLNLLSRP